MENVSLPLIWGIASFIALLVALIMIFVQQRTIASLIVAFQAANTNPALINAIRGATENIPQDAFNKTLAVLAAARTFAPTAELKLLDDQAANFIKEVDHDPSNDPVTGGGDSNAGGPPPTPPGMAANIPVQGGAAL